jgi:hypothetical protein
MFFVCARAGDACVKWTDKWAERLLPGGAREQWGDKWHEQFAHGRGEKNGEVRGRCARSRGGVGGCITAGERPVAGMR